MDKDDDALRFTVPQEDSLGNNIGYVPETLLVEYVSLVLWGASVERISFLLDRQLDR